MSFSSDQPQYANQLPVSIDFPRDQDKFLETLTLIYKRIADIVNTKEGGLFSLQELTNFHQYFTPSNPQTFRNVYRKTFDLVQLTGGPIAPSATVVTPHNINGIKFTTHIYASCTSSSPKFFTVVYPNIYLDSTNIHFTNPTTEILNAVYVIAEYTKN